MTVFARVRRAWPTTLGIHVFQALLAGTFALPLAMTLRYPDVSVREPVATWISALTLGASLGEHTGRYAILPLLAAGLNYPWLSVAWLRALDRPGPFLAHARHALSRYRAACTVAFTSGLVLAVLGVAAYFAALWTGRLVWRWVDERGLDLLCVASTLPFAAAAVVAITAQDIAYAALSREAASAREAFRAALGALRAKLLGLVGWRAALVAAQLALGVAAWLIPRAAFGVGGVADVAVFVATQLAALTLTWARASWLALVNARGFRLAP